VPGQAGGGFALGSWIPLEFPRIRVLPGARSHRVENGTMTIENDLPSRLTDPATPALRRGATARGAQPRFASLPLTVTRFSSCLMQCNEPNHSQPNAKGIGQRWRKIA
jgi:hypothetical protein